MEVDFSGIQGVLNLNLSLVHEYNPGLIYHLNDAQAVIGELLFCLQGLEGQRSVMKECHG